jgi:hypothetical protein
LSTCGDARLIRPDIEPTGGGGEWGKVEHTTLIYPPCNGTPAGRGAHQDRLPLSGADHHTQRCLPRQLLLFSPIIGQLPDYEPGHRMALPPCFVSDRVLKIVQKHAWLPGIHSHFCVPHTPVPWAVRRANRGCGDRHSGLPFADSILSPSPLISHIAQHAQSIPVPTAGFAKTRNSIDTLIFAYKHIFHSLDIAIIPPMANLNTSIPPLRGRLICKTLDRR